MVSLMSNKDQVTAVLKAKKVAHRFEGDNIVLNDGTFGTIYFHSDGKFVGCSRTVKASLAKHINRAVYS